MFNKKITRLSFLLAVIILAVSCGTVRNEYSYGWIDDLAERQKALSGLQKEEEVNSTLTEDGEKSWHSWAEKLLTEDYLQKQIEQACDKADGDHLDNAVRWADIAGLDGFYRNEVLAAYGQAGVDLYDMLDAICYLYLIDPAAAMYSVFEDYVQIAVNNEDASASVVAPATEESNPYFSDNSCRLMPVPVIGLESDQIEDIYSIFKDAHPQYYFIGTHGSLYDDDGVEYGLDLYIYNDFKNDSQFTKVMDALDKAQGEYRTADWDNLEEVEKLRIIYDWLAKHVDYDFYAAGYVKEEILAKYYPDSYKKYMDQNAGSSEDGNPSGDADYTHSQTVWSVFVHQMDDDYPIFSSGSGEPVYAKDRTTKYHTVCAGYSAAFSLLCGNEDLEAIEISGGGHAWNRAKINGQWYNMDCTWDDVGYNPDGPGLFVQYQYFARSDEFFYQSHELSESGIMNNIKENMVGKDDFTPYEHTYYKTDDGWIHGYNDGNGLLFLEENGEPVLDNDGNYLTFDISEIDDENLIPFDDIPGYISHNDGVYEE